jgi:hypothetical protein
MLTHKRCNQKYISKDALYPIMENKNNLESINMQNNFSQFNIPNYFTHLHSKFSSEVTHKRNWGSKLPKPIANVSQIQLSAQLHLIGIYVKSIIHQ